MAHRISNLTSSVPALLALLLVVGVLAATLYVPSRVSAGSCAEDAGNLLRNGTMAPGAANPYGIVANKWKAFVVGSTVPHFENASNEGYDPNGSQYIWRDFDKWDAGIYQKVRTLTPGQTYHFWIVWGQALHDIAGNNARATLMNRQLGIDLTGGTNPTSPKVQWSVPYYGTSGFNRPEWHLTFTAVGTTATFFLRAQNGHTDGRNKVFFDTACLYPANGAPTSTPWSPTPPPPTATPTRTVIPGTRIDDTGTGIAYKGGWSQGSDPRAYNGTYHYGRGAVGKPVALTYHFTGDRVTIWYIGYKNRGRARVLIDGVRVGAIDQYTPGVAFNLSKTFANLSPGVHTLKLKNAGAKNANATDSYIVLDALEFSGGATTNSVKAVSERLTATPAATRTPTRLPPRLIPFQLAAPPAPTPDDPSVIWDPRLPGLNVYLETAAVTPGTLYWKLIRADYHDPFQHGGDFGGDHNLYYVVTDANGTRLPNQKVWQSWPEDSVSALTNAKGIADVPMWANYFPENGPGPYSGYMDSLPSDVVRGMGLPANNHVSFVLYFQKTVKGANGNPTATRTETPSASPTRTRTPAPTHTPTATKPPPTEPPAPTATWTRAPANTATPPGAACKMGVLKTLSVGAGPKGIAFDPATHRVFVGLGASSAVAVIDADSFQLLATWQTDGKGTTNGVAFAAGQVFVTKRDTASVSVLNASNGAFLGNLAVGSSPYGISARGDRVWVANFDDSTVTVINATTRSVIGTIAASQYPALAGALKKRVLVSAWGAGLDLFDTNNQLVHTFATGSGTFGVAVNPNNNKVFVGNRLTSTLSRLNTNTLLTELSAVESETPFALGLNPNTNHLWIVLAGSNRVRVRAGDTFAAVKTLTVGVQGPDGGDSISIWNDLVFVANYAAGTVTILRDCDTADPTRAPVPPTQTFTPSPPPSATAPAPKGCTRRPRVNTPAAGQHLAQKRVRLDWSDMSCARSYRVELARGSPANPPLISTVVDVSEYTTAKLARGKSYYFRVRACNPNGCASWTKWRLFYVDKKQ